MYIVSCFIPAVVSNASVRMRIDDATLTLQLKISIHELII